MVELGRKVCVWLDTDTIQILETIQRQQGFPEKENAIAWLIHEWVEQKPYRKAEIDKIANPLPKLLYSQIPDVFANPLPELECSKMPWELAKPLWSQIPDGFAKSQPKPLGSRKINKLRKTSSVSDIAEFAKPQATLLCSQITDGFAKSQPELECSQIPYRLAKLLPEQECFQLPDMLAKLLPELKCSQITDGFAKSQPKPLISRKTDELTKTSSLLREELEAIYKLSRLQQEILLKLFSETEGHRAVKWNPKEWFGATHPSERSAFSTSLKRLEIRGLVKRQSNDKTAQPKRTRLVKLTNLGCRAAKRLTTYY